MLLLSNNTRLPMPSFNKEIIPFFTCSLLHVMAPGGLQKFSIQMCMRWQWYLEAFIFIFFTNPHFLILLPDTTCGLDSQIMLCFLCTLYILCVIAVRNGNRADFRYGFKEHTPKSICCSYAQHIFNVLCYICVISHKTLSSYNTLTMSAVCCN